MDSVAARRFQLLGRRVRWLPGRAQKGRIAEGSMSSAHVGLSNAGIDARGFSHAAVMRAAAAPGRLPAGSKH
jgi:hypothetical protein